MALTSLVDGVSLDAFASEDDADVREHFSAAGIALTLHRSATAVEFHYLHSLAKPRLQPMEVPHADTVEVHHECVLRFGCVEGDFRCIADTAVYDPQSSQPVAFHANGSQARRLALVANRGEFEGLSGLPFAPKSAADFVRSAKLQCLAVKAGADGCWVFDHEGAVERVPAYRSRAVTKIGSGDVFSAAFAYYWAIAGKDAAPAADAASRHVADYVEDRLLPLGKVPRASEPAPRPTRRRTAMLIAPTEGLLGDWLVSEATASLAEVGIDVGGIFRTHTANLASRMRDADMLVLLLIDGLGWGAQACAVAADAARPVFALVGKDDDDLVAAATAAGAVVHPDLATLAYASAWTS